MRGRIGQHERHHLARRDGELADRRQVLPCEVHWRVHHHHVGAGDGAQRAVLHAGHPGNDGAEAEPQDQLHAHGDAPALANDEPHPHVAPFGLERFITGALVDEHGAAAVAH